MTERAKMLQQMISDDPTDPFLHYGLAMETAKSDPAHSLELFDQILARFPNYLPAYYQAAVLYIERKADEKAKTVLQAGILLARGQGEMKTMGELRTLLDQLEE